MGHQTLLLSLLPICGLAAMSTGSLIHLGLQHPCEGGKSYYPHFTARKLSYIEAKWHAQDPHRKFVAKLALEAEILKSQGTIEKDGLIFLSQCPFLGSSQQQDPLIA